MKKLNEIGVSALAYKEILFKELPQEVIEYAEKNNFPIFSYKEGIWIENIIFEIMDAVKQDDTHHLSESNIENMIQGSTSQENIDRIRRGISLLLSKTVSATYIKTASLDADRIFHSYYINKNLKEKFIVSKYDDGIFILITSSHWKEEAHRIILKEACEKLSLPVSPNEIVLSHPYPAAELHKVFQEAYYGWIAGFMSGRKSLSYENLGVYTAILPLASSPELSQFARTYMDKLKGFEETIKSYINNGGDVIATSLDLKCHANTIRYRLNKMKMILGNKNETDHELFRDLSIAYLVAKYLSKN